MNVLLNLGAGLGVAATGLWLLFGGDDDAIQKHNENELTEADNDPRKKTTQTTQEYQKTTQHSKTKYKNPELLSGDPGNLKIDRATYKITCVGCVMDAELQATLKLINNTHISDVNKQTVVSLFMWIEDNLPKEEQLNNKMAILVNFGRDEGTIKNRGEGQDPFRYDYNNVNPNIQNVIDWFLSKNASPLDFVTRLCNNYGIAAKDEKPQDNKGDIATNPKNPKKKPETSYNPADHGGLSQPDFNFFQNNGLTPNQVNLIIKYDEYGLTIEEMKTMTKEELQDLWGMTEWYLEQMEETAQSEAELQAEIEKLNKRIEVKKQKSENVAELEQEVKELETKLKKLQGNQ